jgi:hypothetical protein
MPLLTHTFQTRWLFSVVALTPGCAGCASRVPDWLRGALHWVSSIECALSAAQRVQIALVTWNKLGVISCMCLDYNVAC